MYPNIGGRGNKLWKCVVESINLDDEYRRYFIIKCTDVAFPEDRHPMSYKDIRKYADMKQDGIVLLVDITANNTLFSFLVVLCLTSTLLIHFNNVR